MVWAVLSFRDGRVAEGLLTLLGAWLAVVVLCGAVGALVQIRDLLAESRD
ncbi:hypothetical protein [Candidatus Palauibacter sp.]